jgi:hypothetical protein
MASKLYHAARATMTEADYFCTVCGERMHEVHCKIICPRCGYTRDCSDP